MNIKTAHFNEIAIVGTVAGDEPPPPPQTKFAYYFQLNAKHGISLQRAEHLFNNLSNKFAYRFDRYLHIICGLNASEIRKFKLHFLYHLEEILTRKDCWEVHTELETSNLQSTYELCSTLRRAYTTPMYDCSRYIPANGINVDGLPQDFPFTPYETWEQKYWRLSQDRDLNCINHA